MTRRSNGAGGQRGDSATSEQILFLRAIRAGWDIPQDARAQGITRTLATLADPTSDARDVDRAVNTLLAVERVRLDATAHEDRMTRLDAGLPTGVEAVLAITDDQLAAVAAAIEHTRTSQPCLPQSMDAPRSRKRGGTRRRSSPSSQG